MPSWSVMSSTSEKLNAAARENDWKTSRLRANGGRVAVDWFGNGQVLLKCTYDTRGHLVEVSRRDRRSMRSHQLGARDPDKVKTVLQWIKAEAK